MRTWWRSIDATRRRRRSNGWCIDTGTGCCGSSSRCSGASSRPTPRMSCSRSFCASTRAWTPSTAPAVSAPGSIASPTIWLSITSARCGVGSVCCAMHRRVPRRNAAERYKRRSKRSMRRGFDACSARGAIAVNPMCHDLERLVDLPTTADPDERESWQRHLAGCAECREQVEADLMLHVALASRPEVGFAAGFDRALRQQLSRRRPPPALERGHLWALFAYVGLAAGLSARILAGIDWSAALSPAVGVLLVVAGLASPFVLLPRFNVMAPPRLD
jgi:hypothetical protein